MNETEILQTIAEVQVTVKGLRLEVEGWRQHVGSSGEFVLVELDRLIGILNELKKRIPK